MNRIATILDFFKIEVLQSGCCELHQVQISNLADQTYSIEAHCRCNSTKLSGILLIIMSNKRYSQILSFIDKRIKDAWLHKRWSFPLRISSVNVTNSTENCGFAHIYCRSPEWKTSFFVQCIGEGWAAKDDHSIKVLTSKNFPKSFFSDANLDANLFMLLRRQCTSFTWLDLSIGSSCSYSNICLKLWTLECEEMSSWWLTVTK